MGNDTTSILGISAFYHDSAACIVRDGAILCAAQEERFTRKKHDPSFPRHAIDFCLGQAGLDGSELDYVAFYEKPFLKFERLLQTYLAVAPRGLASFLKAMPLWLKSKLWLKHLIRTELDYGGPILFPEHHESHAASAFFPSPFDSAAILTMDGVGEWTTTSWGVGAGNQVELKADLQFPHSLGLLYSAFTYFCGFKVNSGEYKLMGLAPYGEPRYVQTIRDNLIDLKDDGSFRLNMDYFGYLAGLTMTNSRFADLFGGPPRAPESTITRREMDLARSIQDMTEDVMLRMARHVHTQTGEKNLCLAGGVALNCVGNGRILREGPFDDLWIQPASGDAGGALGAALAVWHQVLGNPRNCPADRDRRDSQRGSYLGNRYDDGAVRTYLTENSIPFEELPEDTLIDRTASLIAEGKVVGWFSGAMEFGPRALGARSILGDPRSSKMQRTMNLKIKYRESFRPFAPAVLVEHVGDAFALDRPSPYMLLVAPVASERCRTLTDSETALSGLDKLSAPRSDIPAVTHVDNSARIQTVDRRDHPQFWALIEAFRQKTGCPLVINTSFNVRGEPIVCTPADAYRCFMRTEMDVLVVENCLLDKAQQPETARQAPPTETFALD